jgi:PhzF family phenazine biosynthesis protein
MAGHYYLLDTFTREKFKGNPTPVCILAKPLPVQTMYSLAKEFNAPVTAFVDPIDKTENFKIRYFTTTDEIPACGHATLGAAFVLHKQTRRDKITFETTDNLQLQSRQEKEITFITYPKFQRSSIVIPIALRKALGILNSENEFYCKELQSLFIELENEFQVKAISPDFKMLKQSTDLIKEVVAMSKSENQSYDFVLRSFCPWIGIDEDPVTGSIHSVLGEFWQQRLNKNELTAYQASERGGHLIIRPLIDTVEIGGHSQIIIEGSLKE